MEMNLQEVGITYENMKKHYLLNKNLEYTKLPEKAQNKNRHNVNWRNKEGTLKINVGTLGIPNIHFQKLKIKEGDNLRNVVQGWLEKINSL